MSSKEQKIIDICFSLVLTSTGEQSINANFHELSNEEKAAWVRAQLSGCGFETEPCGMSWGVLINKDS